MPSRLHEGMTRTQSPGRGGPQGSRTALVTLLAALLLLTLGWAAVSAVGGDGSHEAQAQTSDAGDSAELAQIEDAPVDDPDAAGDDSGGDPYAAFGEERNPFAPVVGLAEEEGEGATEAGNDGGDESENTTSTDDDPANDSNGTGDDTAETQEAGSPPPQDDTDSNGQNGPDADGGTVSGPNGEQVDCGNPADDFERLLCEENNQGGGSTAGSGPQETGEQQGPPGSGGSGRSGAGEPTESFRNGGGGALK